MARHHRKGVHRLAWFLGVISWLAAFATLMGLATNEFEKFGSVVDRILVVVIATVAAAFVWGFVLGVARVSAGFDEEDD